MYCIGWNALGELLNDGIDYGAGLSGQGLTSGFCSVHLQDVRGYAHNVLIVSEPGLVKRKSGFLKARHKLRRGFSTPPLKEHLAGERRDAAAGVLDELLIRLGKRTDYWTFLRVSLTSHQCESVASAAGLLVGHASRRCLRGRKGPGSIGLLPEHKGNRQTQTGGCRKRSMIHQIANSASKRVSPVRFLYEMAFQQLRLPLMTSEAVLTELFHLVGGNRRETEAAWKFLRSGAVELMAMADSELADVHALMSSYRDRPMDFADATLVHLAKRESLATVFTVDYSDFETYRIEGKRRFRVVPMKRPLRRSE